MATGLVVPNGFAVLTGAGFDRQADLGRQGFSFARARFLRRSELHRGDLERIARTAVDFRLARNPTGNVAPTFETCKPATSRPNRTLQQTTAGFLTG